LLASIAPCTRPLLAPEAAAATIVRKIAPQSKAPARIVAATLSLNLDIHNDPAVMVGEGPCAA
jgi:hypothetical protein